MTFELQRALGRVEGKLDALIAATAVASTAAKERDVETDKRLRKVENRQTWLSGFYAAVGAAIGVGFHKITAG